MNNKVSITMFTVDKLTRFENNPLLLITLEEIATCDDARNTVGLNWF